MHGSTPPEFTMSDAVVELRHPDGAGQPVRALRRVEEPRRPLRAREPRVRITAEGLDRLPAVRDSPAPRRGALAGRAGVDRAAELDAMMSGGLPGGSITIAAGAPGTGKTLRPPALPRRGGAAGPEGAPRRVPRAVP